MRRAVKERAFDPRVVRCPCAGHPRRLVSTTSLHYRIILRCEILTFESIQNGLFKLQ
jgi:hypothetical protein